MTEYDALALADETLTYYGEVAFYNELVYETDTGDYLVLSLSSDGYNNYYLTGISLVEKEHLPFIGTDIHLASTQQAEIDEYNAVKEKMENLDPEIGDVIEFGRYEQDGDLDNGKEPIEWVVLNIDKDGLNHNRALLVSDMVLSWQEYGGTGSWDTATPVSWTISCGLRNWCNGDFYNGSFSTNEKKYILETKLYNGEVDNSAASTSKLETKDNIFVLSADEIYEYCSDNSVGYTTEYVQEKGGLPEDTGYWVRTENWNLSSFMADYCKDGIIYSDEASSTKGVRPAMYLLLD